MDKAVTPCQSAQYVRNIDSVSSEQPGVGAPRDSADEDLSHRRQSRAFGQGISRC